MTRAQNNWAARRRGELDRDPGSRQLSQAVDALRRLNARRAVSARTKADLVGPSEPRYAYLTQSHDEQGLAMPHSEEQRSATCPELTS